MNMKHIERKWSYQCPKCGQRIEKEYYPVALLRCSRCNVNIWQEQRKRNMEPVKGRTT